MYPEFIAIYIGLGVIALLLIVAIILLIILLKKQGSSRPKNYYAQQPQYGRPQQGLAPGRQAQGGGSSGGMAFCRNCGAQFDASLRVCPRCGTPRS